MEMLLKITLTVICVTLSSASVEVTLNCTSTEFLCYDSSKCIPVKLRCDVTGDCPDFSDEVHCPTYNNTCPDGQTLCSEENRCVVGSCAWRPMLDTTTFSIHSSTLSTVSNDSNTAITNSNAARQLIYDVFLIYIIVVLNLCGRHV